MNKTVKLTELKVKLPNQNKDLSQLVSNDLILSWDGNSKFTSSTIEDVDTIITNEMYNISSNGKSVLVSSNQGFWLDGGDEIHPKDLTPGKSKIYLKNNDSILLSVVDSVEKIEGLFITYNVIGSQYRNYILNDFILHNIDLEDYLTTDVIGPNSRKAIFNTDTWSDMGTTYRATRDAWFKGLCFALFEELFSSKILWTDTATQNVILNDLNNDWSSSVDVFMEKSTIFWNSVQGPDDQQTGINVIFNPFVFSFVEDVRAEYNTSFARLEVSEPGDLELDLTPYQSFSETYWNEYKQSIYDMLASQKRILAKYANIRIPENGYGGTIGKFIDTQDNLIVAAP